MKIDMYYTRSSKGKIGKCKAGNLSPEEYVKNCKEQGYDVIKASYNIIDLIEVGDYVNGNKVLDKENHLLWLYDNEIRDTRYVTEEAIKTIVTKEQFEADSYKVGE